jgi:replicative DNA helicase
MKLKGNSYLIGLDTGFKDLNKQTTGFGKGDLIILAARPSMGKTAIALNMVLRNLENDKGVVFFSLEMPSHQLMLRLLSAKTSIELQKLRVGDLDDSEWSRLNDALDDISKKKLFVDDDSLLNINQIKSKLRKLKSQHPDIDLIVIDYLQLMMGTGSKDRHLEVSEISRGLKLLARELDVPIIALSQLNRGVDSRPDKRPMLSDLRESGSIEQDADIIMFVYRDDVYKLKEERDKEAQAKKEGVEYKKNFISKQDEDAELIIGKQRNGPIGTVHLVFHKRFTRFVDKNSIEIDYKPQETQMPNFDESNTKVEVDVV